MDHRYIDDQSVAERYLEHALKPDERTDFEAHFVDCPECMDRLLLAGMFHARNGKNGSAAIPVTYEPEDPIPFRARFVAQFAPWQLVVLMVTAAILLLAIPTAYFLWQLQVSVQR